MKQIIIILIFLLTIFTPNTSKANEAQTQANAAIMLITACSWYKMGQIPRSKIMNFAKTQYEINYGDPSNVNWGVAIKIADKIDKKENLGCF